MYYFKYNLSGYSIVRPHILSAVDATFTLVSIFHSEQLHATCRHHLPLPDAAWLGYSYDTRLRTVYGFLTVYQGWRFILFKAIT